MRLLYTASIVILLVDIIKKQPIKNAVILCNGKITPYVSKDSGYYVLFNLSPGKYNLSVLTDEYMKEEFEISIKFGESKKIILFLSIKSTDLKILNTPRIEFLVYKGKELVKNKEIHIKLNSIATAIKLIKKANQGDEELILNIPENNSFIFQNYFFSGKAIIKSKEDKEKSSNEESKDKLEKNGDIDDDSEK